MEKSQKTINFIIREIIVKLHEKSQQLFNGNMTFIYI